MIKIYFDGGCTINPGGIATFGVIIKQGDKWLWQTSGTLDETDTSSNVAEYAALITGLEWLLDNGYQGEELKVIGDSKLVISQMFRGWRIKNGAYVKYATYCKMLVEQFFFSSGKLIPREQNEQADELTRTADPTPVKVNHIDSEW